MGNMSSLTSTGSMRSVRMAPRGNYKRQPRRHENGNRPQRAHRHGPELVPFDTTNFGVTYTLDTLHSEDQEDSSDDEIVFERELEPNGLDMPKSGVSRC